VTVGFQCQSVLFCYEISKTLGFISLFFYEILRDFVLLQNFNDGRFIRLQDFGDRRFCSATRSQFCSVTRFQ